MYARSREFRDVCTRKRVASDSPIGTASQSPPANIACCSIVAKELDSPLSSKYVFPTKVFVSFRFLKQLKVSTRRAFLWTGSFPAFYAFCLSRVTEVHLVICYFLYLSEDWTCNHVLKNWQKNGVDQLGFRKAHVPQVRFDISEQERKTGINSTDEQTEDWRNIESTYEPGKTEKSWKFRWIEWTTWRTV